MNILNALGHIDPVQFAVIAGLIASTAQSFIKQDGWSADVNRAIAIALALLLGTVEMLAGHKLSTADLAGDFLRVLGATQGWYVLIALRNKAEGLVKPTPTTDLPVTTNP